jgi:hypothetical protein
VQRLVAGPRPATPSGVGVQEIHRERAKRAAKEKTVHGD